MFFGVDCSSLAIHGVIIDDNENLVSLHKWGSKEKEFVYRFPEMLVGFYREFSRIKEVHFAAIEAAIFIQNPKTTIAIANVIGAVWAFLLSKRIEVTIIDNKHWKKIILGKGNASKEDIRNFAKDKWGDVFPEQDYADAACIALWSKRRITNG